MNIKELLRSFIFAFLVTATTNALDMTYHIAVGTAVHLHYVAVKFTILFLAVFLTDYLVGRTTKDAIFGSIAGPLVFYFYYLRATPTLNRSLFVLDEAFGYFFVHATAMYVSYLLLAKIYGGCDEPCNAKKWVIFIAGVTFTLVPHTYLKNVGLHLELSPPNLLLFGILLFLGSLFFIRSNSKNTVTPFVAGLLFIFLDMAYRMVLQNISEEMSSVPQLAILGYVLPHAFIVVASIYALGTTPSLAKNIGWAVLTGALLVHHGAVAGFFPNPLISTPLAYVIDGLFFTSAFLVTHVATQGEV